MNHKIQLEKLLRQQAAIAAFGTFALYQTDLLKVLMEAARVCAEELGVPFAKVCEYRRADNDLLVVAGFGWERGVIGCTVPANKTSPQGKAFTTGRPSICDDLSKDNDFELPPFYGAHGIISTIDVIIRSRDQAYGVLEIDNNKQHDYDQHDIDFLTGFANVIAEAVATSGRVSSLQAALDKMELLVKEKDRLLDQKQILAQELQHRVRNNLQLVYGMLNKQLTDTVGKKERRGINAIARRVSTLARVYDHLLGNEMARTTDFGSYVKSLCHSLSEIQSSPGDVITLTCESDPMILDLDVVTALGIVVAELVSNSYDHAFPNHRGVASVSVLNDPDALDMAIMTISDNGTGFAAKSESKRHGLGLVRRLVEQIHGTVALDSDHGAIWTVRFPTVIAANVTADRSARLETGRHR